MRCFHVQLELEAYVDRELSPGQAALLEQHLAGCEDCRAELARLQEVVAALETWPLVTEPVGLTAQVMTRVRSRPVMSLSAMSGAVAGRPLALPSFRIHWSDLAISLAGAGLVFAAALICRYLNSTDLAHLYRLQMYLRLEMLRLEVLLLTQRLLRTDPMAWGLMLMGVVLVVALCLTVWDLGVWKRKALSV